MAGEKRHLKIKSEIMKGVCLMIKKNFLRSGSGNNGSNGEFVVKVSIFRRNVTYG